MGTAQTVTPPDAENIQGPFVSELVVPARSRAVRDLPAAVEEMNLPREIRRRVNPLQSEPDAGKRGTWSRANVPLDNHRFSTPVDAAILFLNEWSIGRIGLVLRTGDQLPLFE